MSLRRGRIQVPGIPPSLIPSAEHGVSVWKEMELIKLPGISSFQICNAESGAPAQVGMGFLRLTPRCP